ncbi:MAG: FkbM family methyltransferase [bacterium]|nr:FkbM family methyltransferase [bacterium]
MNTETFVSIFRSYGWWDGVKSAVSALWYYIEKYALRRQYICRNIFSSRMYLDARDPGISKTLAIFRKRELEHRYILSRVIKPGMVIWDLGANIGYYALMEARLVGEQGKVYAIEPSPSNAALLLRNINCNQLGGIVEVTEGAISSTNGVASFYLSEMSNVHTFHPTSFRGEKKLAVKDVIEVKTFDVPTFLHGKRFVDLVRMDIEGHEVEVFGSIVNAIDTTGFSAMILFETHFAKYDDQRHNMRQQLQALFARGYVPRYLASTNESTARFHERGHVPECVIRTDNVLRGLYRDLPQDEAIEFICDIGGVRTVLLTKADA